MSYFDVSNVTYHKFSYDADSYRLNWANVKVMLESPVTILLSLPKLNCDQLLTPNEITVHYHHRLNNVEK